MLGARRSSQASAACIGVAPKGAATSDKIDDCSGLKPPSGKVRDIGNAVAGQIVDQGIVGAMRQIVVILHADDLANTSPFSDLRRRDIAQADTAHEALVPELGQQREWGFDRSFGRSMRSAAGVVQAAKVHDVEHIQSEIAQTVVDRLNELFGGECRNP